MMWNTNPSTVIAYGDCSDRQQDFGGRGCPFDGAGQGIEFAHGPIAKTRMTVVPRAVRVPAPG
jgi:hypothetical protein